MSEHIIEIMACAAYVACKPKQEEARKVWESGEAPPGIYQIFRNEARKQFEFLTDAGYEIKEASDGK